MSLLRILLADDHEIVRKGLGKIAESQPGWKIVAEVSNGRAAVQKVQELKPLFRFVHS
jgi:DNA-binding NarL/FixJ family response regulator